MDMRIKLMMFLYIGMSQFSFAEDGCKSWGCVSTVSEITTKRNGYIFVATPLDENLANCAPYAGKYFSINPDFKNSREMYSSLLSAYMSSKKIQLRVVEGSQNCELSYVRLSTAF